MDTRAEAGYAAYWITEDMSGEMAVTEAEWLECTEPERMLIVLHRHFAVARSQAGRRRLRLFACACCRTIWHLLDRSAGHEAVLVVERYADGMAKMQAVEAARAAVWALPSASDPSVYMTATGPSRMFYGAIAPAHAALPQAYFAARNAARYAQQAAGLLNQGVYADLLRCILGNPFRPVAIDPNWLTWHDGLLVAMAQKMYNSRDFRDMPVLADALEEAGCQDQEILDHCRSGGEHVRGCWVIDALLGKT